MANEAKEIIARAYYACAPAMDQETDGDYRPVGEPYAYPWEALDEIDGGATMKAEAFIAASSILAAIDSAGLEIRETFTPTTICADEDQLCPTCGQSVTALLAAAKGAEE